MPNRIVFKDDESGRPIGKYIQAECDAPYCREVINRGLAHCCSMPDCETFLCAGHMIYDNDYLEGIGLCSECYHERCDV